MLVYFSHVQTGRCLFCLHYMFNFSEEYAKKAADLCNRLVKKTKWCSGLKMIKCFKTWERWMHIQAVTSVLVSFLITVDWPGEGSSALFDFTKDAFSLTVTTWSKNMALHKLFCVFSVHAGVLLFICILNEALTRLWFALMFATQVLITGMMSWMISKGNMIFIMFLFPAQLIYWLCHVIFDSHRHF